VTVSAQRNAARARIADADHRAALLARHRRHGFAERREHRETVHDAVEAGHWRIAEETAESQNLHAQAPARCREYREFGIAHGRRVAADRLAGVAFRMGTTCTVDSVGARVHERANPGLAAGGDEAGSSPVIDLLHRAVMREMDRGRDDGCQVHDGLDSRHRETQ
jgi:hypothetical protein